MQEQKLIRTNEAARILGVSKSTLHRWVQDHSIPHYRVQHTLLFDPAEIIEWVKARHRVEVE